MDLLRHFYSGVDFSLSLKTMLLFPTWYGKPYWKYLKLKNRNIIEVAQYANEFFYLFRRL